MESKKKKTRDTRQKVLGRSGKEHSEDRSFSSVVGPQPYSTFVDMLRALVPDGRTHRLAVVVAGMLQHAARIARKRWRGRPPQGSVAASLLRAEEEPDPDFVRDEIGDALKRLFRDSGVLSDRVSARGESYSILDAAIQEFVCWENMPWE